MGNRAALLLPDEAASAGSPSRDEPERAASPSEATGIRALHLVPPDTFETFFEQQYTNLLKAMYLVTGNRHEAEEITQDAFVRALER
jgi:RNA polymerase sigma factor (sigma-70 family)